MAAQALGECAGKERLPGVDCQHAELSLACAAHDGSGLCEQGADEIGIVSLAAPNLLVEQIQI
jgi:hypothetical protein